MNIAVRYYSKGGNTKRIADAIAEAAGVSPVSITEEPALPERVDVLFLGGAPYANLMAPELKAYAQALTPELVGKVVLFTTSNWSHRTVLTLQKLLQKRGIPVENEHFFARAQTVDSRRDDATAFAKRMLTL